MDSTNYQSVTKRAVKGKFRGRKAVRCRYIQHFPSSAEREYKRVSGHYAGSLSHVVKRHFPGIASAYKKEDTQTFRDNEKAEVYAMAAELQDALHEFGLYDAMGKISQITQNNSIREWQQAVRNTLGVDILDDYYRGELYQQLMERWIADNVTALSGMPYKAVMDIDRIIMEGYKSGKPIAELQKEILDSCRKTKWWLTALAVGQVGALNAGLTKMIQTDSGVGRYWWSSSKDSRVRDCHRAFEGRIFRWDNPPMDWHYTKTKGIVYTGQRFHPGEAHGCRCCAIPVFDWDTLSIPIRGD